MIDLPANYAGRSSDGRLLPYRCARCGADACYWNGLDWLCTEHHIEEQTQ